MKTLKAINDIAVDKLTTMEQGALAKLLDAAWAEKDAEDHPAEDAYTAAVDFLWMAFRLSAEEENELLDLLDELPETEGWWEP